MLYLVLSSFLYLGERLLFDVNGDVNFLFWPILNYATTQNEAKQAKKSQKPIKTSQNYPKGDLKQTKTTQNKLKTDLKRAKTSQLGT